MSDQEIIDAIDAEIARTEKPDGMETDRETRLTRLAYLYGLRFARALIVKRMEGGK